MKFKQKILMLCCLPLIIFGALSLVIGLVQFQSGMYEQTQKSLKSSGLAAISLYDSKGYGDYSLKEDGTVWRGLNYNVSDNSLVVDSIKDQTGVDITFFYQDTAVMTSVCDKEGNRLIGMQAWEDIKTSAIGQGEQLWYRNIEIDHQMCHAYVIPITQSSDGSVVGAIMASEPTTEFNRIINRYILISVVISAVLLVGVIIFIFWYVGNLSKVLHDVRRVLKKVADGDLSDERLKKNKRKDEFGDLMTSTEILRTKIANILNSIQQGTDRLTTVVDKLGTTSHRTTETAHQMNLSVNAINETADRQKQGTQVASNDVESTNSAIEQIIQRISDVNELSNKMTKLAEESCNILAQLQESSQSSQLVINRVSEQTEANQKSVQEIKNVTEYITNIADETNLLALNASIEAARAGEAGRGFAIVAQQIQKLAEESNNSANQIGQSIQQMVEDSEKIVAVMQTIEETMKTQEEKIQQTKSIFDQLNNNIQLVTSKEADMQANVTIMNSSKDDMSGIISSLELSASDNLASSENAANMTGQMMEEIRGLSDLTGTLQELSDNLKNTLESFLA